jgi:hypothetical protein
MVRKIVVVGYKIIILVLVKQSVCFCDHQARTPLTPPGHYGREFNTRIQPCANCGGNSLDRLTLKITDFGLAREVYSLSRISLLCG